MNDVELSEIREFVAECPPFSMLDEEALGELVRNLSVGYLRRGSRFPPSDDEQTQLYLVRKGAIELRDEDDRLHAKFAEGDLFDPASTGVPDGHAHTVEDVLFYCLAGTRLQELRRQHPAVDAYFARSVAEHLRHARRHVGDDLSHRTDALSVAVAGLMDPPPPHAGPDCSIREAARLMTERRTSALLVVDGGRPTGIVTDRDLRTRCVAEGLSLEREVAAIMTPAPYTVGLECAAFEALMTMTRHGIDHLPVVDGRGEVCGLVSSRGLLRAQRGDAAHLALLIRRSPDPAALVPLASELGELQMAMLAAGAGAGQIGQALSSIADALTQRLVELAEAELGPAPVAYAWLACGSQGRHEQGVHSDQDNALIFDDEYRPAEHGPYFEELARRVTDGLDACGFRYCPGDVMASNPRWRLTLSEWVGQFRQWLRQTDRSAAMLLANFADLRPVAGAADLHARLAREIVAECAQGDAYLNPLVENTLENRPPLGFFRNFVLIEGGEHAHTLDIKVRGLLPVVDLARIQALATGSMEVNTVRRLRATASSLLLTPHSAGELEEAYEFLGLLRVRHEVEQIRSGLPPDNFIDPDRLSGLERRHLKDAFSVVAGLQRALGLRFMVAGFP